jgi:FMN phosphatase YigB (HAD superfamily)
MICFDLGGVLVKTAPRWDAACANAGVAMPREWREAFPWDRLAPIVDQYERDALSWDEYLHRTAQALEARHSVEELGRIHEGWLLGEFGEVAEIVRRLNATPGVISSCLSNTNRRHWEIMEREPERYAAFHALTRRWNSFELGLRKPDAEIYRAVESGSGVAAGQILFFDDREENVEAARQRGWRAELVAREGDPAGQIRSRLAAHGIPGF